MKDTIFLSEYEDCRLCGRACGVNRNAGQRGFCGCDVRIFLGRAALHHWEEPIISGERGSGTVFFVGCSLGCIFCQNREISRLEATNVKGTELSIDRLAKIMKELQAEGAHNINLVTPTHYVPSIIQAVKIAREQGMELPIVYNTGSYELPHTVDMLDGVVDVYLADMKFYRSHTAGEYAGAADYPQTAMKAIAKMYAQRGAPIIEDGIIRSGVVVRILLLPGHLAEAKLTVKYLYDTYGDNIYISLMNQYTPIGDMPAPLSRRVTVAEYEELVEYAASKGVKNAFIQEYGTAKESFIPSFDGVN